MFSLSSHPEIPDTSIEKALLMQKMLIAVAENGSLDENVYSIRREFMNSNAESLLPEIIKTCRDQGSVGGYLKKCRQETVHGVLDATIYMTALHLFWII